MQREIILSVCRIHGLVVVLCLALFGLPSAGQGADVEAEVVWAASDGLRYELFDAVRKAGKWSGPVKITDDNADNLHPCIDAGPDGRKWLVWTAVEQGGYEIRYAYTRDGEWTEPKTLPSPLPSNIAPGLIVDEHGVPWVVWAGNDGRHNDDIYFSRFVHGKWRQPALVNRPNDVPDILPMIEKNETGNVQVTWQGYRDGQYVQLVSTWNGRTWGPEKVLADHQGVEKRVTAKMKTAERKIELPEFVPDNRQVFVRTYNR